MSIPPAHSIDIGLIFTELKTGKDLSGEKNLSFK